MPGTEVMISFIKTLLRDRRGNALVIAAAAMPLVVGFAGLATDTIQWTLWRRELQRAADSAAFAGVYARAQETGVGLAVSADLTNNNKTGITLLSGYPHIAYPTSPNWENGVRVTLALQKKLGFSSLFLPTAPMIITSGTAAMIDDGNYCLWARGKGSGPGISIDGNSRTRLGCDAISNKKGPGSVSADGNYSFVANVVAAAGSMPSSITGVTKLKPNRTPLPDPFANKYSTAIPAGMQCRSFVNNRKNLGTGNNPDYHLSPGCYTSFSPNGSNTYTLDPGVYYIDSANFNLNGLDTLVGTGVTIILTGTTPGNIAMNGTSTVNLTAPTTGPYANMLFIQSASAALNNNNTFDGTAASKLDGSIYLPNGKLTFQGTSGSVTKCVMLVVNQAVFTGNADLQNDTDGCTAATTVPGKSVRLVA
jgi:Flp pilus assembly protein TadG